MRKESSFQHDLIKDIKKRFRGCFVLKNDPTYIQGIPDLLVLYRDRWAALECKRERNEKRRPNQEHYVQKLNKMSYASFVYPENREEVLDELEHAFRSRRSARVPQPQQVPLDQLRHGETETGL